MRQKGLTKTQLQYIAIIAMVIDHTAWGFVEFYSPLGQIMHTIGRLTLPIMCFFIAEGFRHTTNLKMYIGRMASFAVISIIPFYIFFHEEYGYRQNIIFDLLLALLTLTVAESKRLGRWVKATLIGGIILVSMAIGGWVLLPICYVLIFYYGKNFRQKAKLFCGTTCLMEVLVVVAILLNQRWNFMSYDWEPYQWIYFLGFMLALIPLYFYNGQKGKTPGCGRYFFYMFYPLHFLALSFVKYGIVDFSWQRIYIYVHVAALLLVMIAFLYVMTARNSKAQTATLLFIIVAIMYIYGFIMEITTYEVAGVYTATKLQYFAITVALMIMTLCIGEFCRVKIPAFVYALEIGVSVLVLYCMFTVEENGWMYSGISINYDGPFPRMQIESYGPAFYGYLCYCAVICVGAFAVGIRTAIKKGELERKRLRNFLYGVICMWVPYVFKILGWFGGYEFPAVGIALTTLFISRALVKYSYLDSIDLGFDNAINKGREGLLVIDNTHNIIYHNEFVHKIFGNFHDYEDAFRIEDVQAAFEGTKKTVERGDHIYELRVEPLMESGQKQGQILWAFDLTEHYRYLTEARESAVTDPLTGICNRRGFEQEVIEALEKNVDGTFVILDLDNFKKVNDSYGHQMGDRILMALGTVIKRQKAPLLSGRIGGDEFCLYYCRETNREKLEAWAQEMIHAFSEELIAEGCGPITSITIGMEIVKGTQEESGADLYQRLYRHADRALYVAKEAGKGTYYFYNK